MVVIEGNGSRPSHQGNGYKESEIMYTLNTVEVPAVAMADTTHGNHYSTSKNSHHTVASHEKANTLVASDWKDPPVVNDAPNNEPTYIVRRLTPTETIIPRVKILTTQSLLMKKQIHLWHRTGKTRLS